ncbi:E3 ubiquitin-protein ligase MIB2 [Platysternon megacephalum]|uniref:E3 ubiquitin-protein ligase MIB2 n=1 Tax=Platysternon megacephalum TaxID=55544 RepID=A0A4D9ES13_9SAUR|nr:E3 ubiquitin-protein ligase MIB2 [Platysternon megacephalum]
MYLSPNMGISFKWQKCNNQDTKNKHLSGCEIFSKPLVSCPSLRHPLNFIIEMKLWYLKERCFVCITQQKCCIQFHNMDTYSHPPIALGHLNYLFTLNGKNSS